MHRTAQVKNLDNTPIWGPYTRTSRREEQERDIQKKKINPGRGSKTTFSLVQLATCVESASTNRFPRTSKISSNGHIDRSAELSWQLDKSNSLSCEGGGEKGGKINIPAPESFTKGDPRHPGKATSPRSSLRLRGSSRTWNSGIGSFPRLETYRPKHEHAHQL